MPALESDVPYFPSNNLTDYNVINYLKNNNNNNNKMIQLKIRLDLFEFPMASILSMY